MNMTPFRTGLEIETDIVGNVTNIFFLANRNSGLVAQPHFPMIKI